MRATVEFGGAGVIETFTAVLKEAILRKSTTPGKSLYALVRDIEDASRVPINSSSATRDLRRSAPTPKRLTERFNALDNLSSYNYSMCPYACKACNRKAIRDLLVRDYRMCRGCRMDGRLTIHHVVPRDEGGTNIPENLIVLCSTCHDLVECDDSRPRTIDCVMASLRRLIKE